MSYSNGRSIGTCYQCDDDEFKDLGGPIIREILYKSFSEIYQNAIDTASTAIDIEQISNNEEKVSDQPYIPDQLYDYVEQMPVFKVGDMKMMEFVSENLKYPISAVTEDVEGRVIVKFLVTENGDLTDIKIVRGIHPDCDKEAIRIVELVPKWQPATQNGRAIPIYYTLPFLFKLQR